MTHIQISRVLHPVRVLGPGDRAVIWTQGCSLKCPGCMAHDTWPTSHGESVPVDALVDWVSNLGHVDGITISGGEPSEQAEPLAQLLALLRRRIPPVCDILVYSGREVAWVQGPGRPVFAGADAVMAGRYVAAEAGHRPLRGSDNQELVILTPLGADRYGDEPQLPSRGPLQLGTHDEGVYVVGIPLPGVLSGLRSAAATHGVTLRRRSW